MEEMGEKAHKTDLRPKFEFRWS